MDKTMDCILVILGVFTVVLITLLVIIVIDEGKSEKITPVKNNWACTGYKQSTHLVLIGKVLLPQVQNTCVNYKMNID